MFVYLLAVGFVMIPLCAYLDEMHIVGQAGRRAVCLDPQLFLAPPFILVRTWQQRLIMRQPLRSCCLIDCLLCLMSVWSVSTNSSGQSAAYLFKLISFMVLRGHTITIAQKKNRSLCLAGLRLRALTNGRHKSCDHYRGK